MNIIFTAILTASLTVMLFIAPQNVMTSLINGGSEGLNFAMKIFAVYSVWLSIMSIWNKIGFDKTLSKHLKPLTAKLFPNEEEDCYSDLAVNLSANILGMGSAGTPSGINATKKFKSHKNRTMLLVINSTSIQLIPTTVIAIRSTFAATTDIVLPTLIATTASTLCGIILVKIFVK